MKKVFAVLMVLLIFVSAFSTVGFRALDPNGPIANAEPRTNGPNTLSGGAGPNSVFPIGSKQVNATNQVQSMIISVPYYSQIKNYYCGEAALEMVFNYYGPNISQYEIANVARAQSGPGTYTDDMMRAGHFSNLSTSVGNDAPGYQCTGYTARKLGYGAYQYWFTNQTRLSELRHFLDKGSPIVVLTWYDLSHSNGHFRVVIGYDSNGIIAHDPWNGASQYYTDSTFNDLWSYSNYWAMFTSPWSVSISSPSNVGVNSTFQVNANITYVCPNPFGLYQEYPAASSNATIQLPPGFSLANGETPTKHLSGSYFNCRESRIVSWNVIASSTVGNYSFSVTAAGNVQGSVGSHGPYQAYSYTDRIGGMKARTLIVGLHDVAITSVVSSKTIVGQSQSVGINVTVANLGGYSEVFNVTTYANTTVIGEMQVALASGNSTVISFTWNTTSFPYSHYNLTAYASPVINETNTANNRFAFGIVTATIPGDVNGDKTVNVLDLILIALHMGIAGGNGYEPYTSDWYKCMNTDLNNDGKHNVLDLILCALHLGQHW